jgi:hypothetical protein
MAGLLLVAAALRSGGPRTAAAVAVVLAGTGVSTRLLKPLSRRRATGPTGASSSSSRGRAGTRRPR